MKKRQISTSTTWFAILSLLSLFSLISCGSIANNTAPVASTIAAQNSLSEVAVPPTNTSLTTITSEQTTTQQLAKSTSTPRPTAMSEFIMTTPSIVRVLTSNVEVGKYISDAPWGYKDRQVYIRKVNEPPDFSYQDAMKFIYNKGYTWALGGQYRGKQISVSAIYGRGDIGYRDEKNGGWVGKQNSLIETCLEYKKCTLSAERYPSFENRKMWVIDYGNLDKSLFLRPPSICDKINCLQPDHYLVAVDIEFKGVIHIGEYAETGKYSTEGFMYNR